MNSPHPDKRAPKLELGHESQKAANLQGDLFCMTVTLPATHKPEACRKLAGGITPGTRTTHDVRPGRGGGSEAAVPAPLPGCIRFSGTVPGVLPPANFHAALRAARHPVRTPSESIAIEKIRRKIHEQVKASGVF